MRKHKTNNDQDESIEIKSAFHTVDNRLYAISEDKKLLRIQANLRYYKFETEDEVQICDGYGDYVVCLHSDKIIRKYHVGGKISFVYIFYVYRTL